MRILSIIFLLGIAGGALCLNCTSPEKTLPCTCKYISYFDALLIKCNDNRMSLEDLKQVLSGTPDEADLVLWLIGLNLGNVSSDFFNGSRIVRLYISNCALDSLADDIHAPALVGLENSLEELELTNSLTKENAVARLNISHLQKLDGIRWSKNRIPEMGNDWFDDAPASLRRISIINNGINTLGDRVFANLLNLTNVELREDPLNLIKRSMFPLPAERLKSITMQKIHVSKIPEDIFSSMPSLDSVSLEYMRISELERNMWEPIMDNLRFISLDGNPLLCDSHMNWLVEYNMTKDIRGTCRFPEERNGTSLMNFIQSMQQ